MISIIVEDVKDNRQLEHCFQVLCGESPVEGKIKSDRGIVSLVTKLVGEAIFINDEWL